jgi:integrase
MDNRGKNWAPIHLLNFTCVAHSFNTLNIPSFSWDDLRYTHATIFFKANVHPKIVERRLCHTSITTTLDIYSHVSPGLQQAAALRFDEEMGNNPEKINSTF